MGKTSAPWIFQEATDSKAWKGCSCAIITGDRALRGLECLFAGSLFLSTNFGWTASDKAMACARVLHYCSKGRNVFACLMCLRDFIELAGGKRFQSDNDLETLADLSSLISSTFTPWSILADEGCIAPSWPTQLCWYVATLTGIGEPVCAFASRCHKRLVEGACPLDRISVSEGVEALFQGGEAMEDSLPPTCYCALGIVSSALSTSKELLATMGEWNEPNPLDAEETFSPSDESLCHPHC